MPPVHRHMSRDVLAVDAAAPVVAVARRMAHPRASERCSCSTRRLSRIMTGRDLKRAVGRSLCDDAVAGECMTADPDTIAPEDTIEHPAH